MKKYFFGAFLFYLAACSVADNNSGPKGFNGVIATAHLQMNNKIYVVGGWNGTSFVDDVYSFDIGGTTPTFEGKVGWGTVEPGSATGVVFKEKMYVFANRTSIFASTDGKSWDAVGTNPFGEHYSAVAVATDEAIYVVGGSEKVWKSTDGVTYEQIATEDQLNRQFVAAVADSEGNLYVIGGGSRNDVFRSKDGGLTWSAFGEPQWLGREGHGSFFYNGHVYIVGGENKGRYLGDMWRMNTSTGVWENMNISSSGFKATSKAGHILIDNTLYVISGLNMDGGKVAFAKGMTSIPLSGLTVDPDGGEINYTFDATVKKLQMTSPLRKKAKAVVFKDKIWLISGYETPKDVQKFDGSSWTKAPDLPWEGSVDTVGAVVFKTKLYVFASSTSIDKYYSTDGTTWTEEGQVPWYHKTTKADKNGLQVLATSDTIYIVGGLTSGKPGSSYKSTDGKIWTPITPPASINRIQCGATGTIENQMVIIGGKSNNEELNSVSFSTDGINWTTEVSSWHARMEHSGTAADNRKIFVFGGVTQYFNSDREEWRGFNDLYISDDNGKKWKEYIYKGDPMPSEIKNAAFVHYKDKIYIFGGDGSGAQLIPDAYEITYE
ncbi:MAG: Kelch repeat-containing protein [Brevinema sp.]